MMKWNETDRTAGGSAGSPVSLYLHFPFCVRKCRYCDFLSGPADEGVRERYLRALEREAALSAELLQRKNFVRADNLTERIKDYGRKKSAAEDEGFRNISGGPTPVVGSGAAEGKPLCVDTVFLGGGTPSLMSGEELGHLMEVLRENFRILPDAEITMECNPGTVDRKKLAEFRRAGVNRLSIGVQSFREEELRLLGRIHTAEEARACFLDARAAGFENISLDLISALPGQSGVQWMESLREAVRLSPEHISAYSLILEDGTPLKEEADAGKLPPLPEEELDRKMYHDTKTFLAQHGYHRYEISNYAKDGFESRHNSGYWTGHPYLGFGIGAASYYGNRRWSHTGSLVRYLELLEDRNGAQGQEPARAGNEVQRQENARTGNRAQRPGTACVENVVQGQETEHMGNGAEAPEPDGFRQKLPESLYEEEETLDEKDRMAEFMFLGLRRMRGVSEGEFERLFGRSMESVYGPVLKRYQKLGMLERKEGRVFLTDAGIDVSNAVMADFLLD